MAGTVITAKGRALLAKLIAMEGGLSFLRAAVGTGVLPSGYDPSNILDLNHYKMDGKITAAFADGDVANVTFQIASEYVSEGFLVTEAGLFAADPDEGEVLYAYLDMSKDPQYIYAKGGAINKVAEITLGVIIGQIDKVTATIAPDGLINKTVFEKTVYELRQEMANMGRVLIGSADTVLKVNDTLFVVDDDTLFRRAAFTNLVFQPETPTGLSVENWAQTKTGILGRERASPDEINILSGKLAVSREAPKDAAFFAKIN